MSFQRYFLSCALDESSLSIKRVKGLNKGCILYTGASYTREITVIGAQGGHSGTEGGRTFVTYFAEEGVFF